VVTVAALAAGVLLSATVGVVDAQSSGLSEELSEMVSQYIAAWNTHDPAALAEYFTADADMIMGNGPILEGRAEIQSSWREYFAVQEPERTLTIEILGAREIATGVALLNVRTTTGGRTAQGIELLSRYFRGTWVLVRHDGDWLVSAMRGMPTQQDRIIRGGD
jgi:uncharacterized protein (TIGR02246 family)